MLLDGLLPGHFLANIVGLFALMGLGASQGPTDMCLIESGIETQYFLNAQCIGWFHTP